MWDRKELKAKGKAAYKANRVACIIAALLLTLATGAAGGASAGSTWNNYHNSNDSNYTQDIEDISDDSGEYSEFDVFNDEDADINQNPAEFISDEPTSDDLSLFTPVLIGVIAVVVLIALAFGLALGAFLLNPLQVGLQKFFIDNATDRTTGLNRDNVGVAFNNNYMKVVGSMFSTGIFTALWCLLLIIPGIYKAYCWRLVPYIVSEDTAITGREARELSAKLMNGNKWDSFVLDLSFLGWKILGGFTLGILNIIFTNPYQAATNAELYLTLSGRPSEFAAPAEPVKEDAPEVEFSFDQEGIND